MSENLRMGKVVIIVMAAALSFAGCAVKKKVVEPAEEKAVEVLAAERVKEEAPVEAETLAVEELSAEERRRIEEEELARREREEEEEALRALESLVPGDIYFAFDRSDLSASARETLAGIADRMEKISSVRLRLEGHADERGTSEYNLALGERRANAAERYLISLGIDENRLSTISYGEEMPADAGHSEEAWAKNRRVHIEIAAR